MIDKIIPRHLDSDTDERLVEEGVMTDALNVGMFSTTGGTGVLQNAISTNAIQPESGAVGVSDNAVVIGSVSDAQRGFIYFFVKDTSDANLDGVYRYEASSNTYKRVFTHSWFGFREQDTVQADVVNAAFQQDGVLQSVIYFTDGYNPPRKINVDRALTGDYNGMSSDDLDIALSVIRAASTKPPTFRFVTDSNFTENNFHRNSFQYATQIVYKDGEISALSPYSKLAVNPFTFFGALEEGGYGTGRAENNTCVINHQVGADIADVKKVRILARETNDGSFFLVDEFDPSSNISRDVFGVATNVYNASAKEYRFYNERIGEVIDTQESSKLYNNVPLKAVGQTVAGNRLMYSNYTEGRPNWGLDADVSVVYNSSVNGYKKYIVDSDNVLSYSEFEVTANLTGGSLISNGTTIIATGALLDLSFDFNPNFTASDINGLLTWEATTYDESTSTYGTDNVLSNSVVFHSPESATFSISVINEETQISSSFASYVQSILDESSLFVEYLIDFNTTQNGGEFTDIPVIVEFKFGEVASSSDNTISFVPRIVNISFDFDRGEDIDLIFNSNQLEYRVSENEDLSDMYANVGDSQDECIYSSITNAPSTFYESLVASSVSSTFKSGATHSFGVVYYDKWGRCGFVNEIGSAYVKYPAERDASDNKAGASVSISFASDQDAPDWADSYQIVYNGSSVSNCVQYTVGGAYVKRLPAETGTRDIDTSVHNIYVSLKTLDIYKSDKEVFRDYSFTEGDKLRIVSMRDDTNASTEYPLSVLSNVIEFDVVGVVQDPGDDIAISAGTEGQDIYKGTFLVLSAPQVEASRNNLGAVNEYVGFDWFYITGEDYNAADSPSGTYNYWNRQVIVDIVTPKKTTEQSVYYEIGERRKIGVSKVPDVGDHGPAITTNSGDTWYRPIPCKTPIYSSGWISISDSTNEDHTSWEYKPLFVEDLNITDLYESKDWHKGRAHTTFKNAATINRFNGVTWSDLYEEDVSVLSLSSFTPSTANFFSYESKFGAVNYLANFRSDLLAIQENKMSIAPVNKEFLNYADGSASVAVSNTVIGTPQYASGDYGIGSDTSSALVYDGQAFFVDRSRRKVMRYAGGQLEPISDKGVSSLFAEKISASSSKLISGYDPGEDMYYVTIAGSPGTTVGYNVALGKWQSKYSFVPDCYSLLDDVMFSFKSADISSVKYIMHSHDGATRLNFYGTSYSSEVSVISKYSPDSVKVFNALSLHSDEAWGARVTSDLDQDTGDGNMSSSTFSEREGAWYRNITGNNVDSYKVIGVVGSVNLSSIIFLNKLMGLSIPFDSDLYRWDDSSSTWIDTDLNVETVNSSQRKITTDAPVGSGYPGYLIAIKSVTPHTDGDRIRGHYAKIKLTNNSSNKVELFSISTHITNSPLNHALGQQ